MPVVRAFPPRAALEAPQTAPTSAGARIPYGSLVLLALCASAARGPRAQVEAALSTGEGVSDGLGGP